MYDHMSEDNMQELKDKLAFAVEQGKTFSPKVRPELIKANQFWTREIERLTHKIRYLFEI